MFDFSTTFENLLLVFVIVPVIFVVDHYIFVVEI
jgi:hypothetical protein